jgi:hypothetical protein
MYLGGGPGRVWLNLRPLQGLHSFGQAASSVTDPCTVVAYFYVPQLTTPTDRRVCGVCWWGVQVIGMLTKHIMSGILIAVISLIHFLMLTNLFINFGTSALHTVALLVWTP